MFIFIIQFTLFYAIYGCFFTTHFIFYFYFLFFNMGALCLMHVQNLPSSVQGKLENLKSIITNCVTGCSGQMNSDYAWLWEADITVGSIFLLHQHNFHCNWRIIVTKQKNQNKTNTFNFPMIPPDRPRLSVRPQCFWDRKSPTKGTTKGTPTLLLCNYTGTFIKSHYEYLISERILQNRLNLVIFQLIIVHNRLLCCNSSVGLQKIIR